jgi:ornithine cyclodeaminase/alanine dehydrogenase-like protein (mu-crystallin family)
MTLVINNKDVAQVLTMEATIDALEQAYRDLARREAVCRPRIDIRIPTSDPAKNYQWGSMEGGSPAGYFAVRMKSDVVYEQSYNGALTQEKYCVRPGLYCGLILLTSIETGEPLAIINDGVLQHMRVAADGGIGVKYMANPDAEVVGMLGSGGMARSHMQAFMHVRNIKKLQVYSPTKANRDAFGYEMSRRYNIEVQVCDRPEDIYRGADIVAALTDSAVAVLDGDLLEQGAHIINIGSSGVPDARTMERVDLYLRFGDAPAPVGMPDLVFDDEFIGWEARPGSPKYADGRGGDKRAYGNSLPDKRITLAQIWDGKGRTSPGQITWSQRGNLQGAQFYAVGGKVYELAKAAGLGYEIPTDLFLQDIRD